MVVAITADAQDVWPPRVLLSVTGLTPGDSVQLLRIVGAQRIPVRAGADSAVTDAAFLRVDAELPFGVPVGYVAVVNDVDVSAGPSVTYALPGGKNALTDAISGLAAEVTIADWPSRTRTRPSTTFAVGGRNVVVSGPFGGWTGQVVLFTDAESTGDVLESLIEQATEGVMLLRQGSGAKRIDTYLTVTSYTEERFDEHDGADERRLWILDAVGTESWAADLEASGYTLLDLANAYEGLTLADLANDFDTLLDLAQAEFPT